MKTINKGPSSIIPKKAKFVCPNCSTEFESDEFSVNKREVSHIENVNFFSGSGTEIGYYEYYLQDTCPSCEALAWLNILIPGSEFVNHNVFAYQGL